MSSYLLICGYIYILENHFSFLDFIMENVMLELKVLRSFWNTSFSLKDSYRYDQYSASFIGFIFCFLLAHNIVARLKMEHIHVELLLSL
jgi:hypothetical protein